MPAGRQADVNLDRPTMTSPADDLLSLRIGHRTLQENLDLAVEAGLLTRGGWCAAPARGHASEREDDLQ
jgi:hypothetical protein